MKKFILFLCTIVSIQVSADEMANFEGYVSVNKKLFTNVFNVSPGLGETGQFIGELFNTFGSSPLLELTGFYSGDLNNGKMTNGIPNSVSVMIYYFLFNGVAEKISKDCQVIDDPMTRNHYQSLFLKHLENLCKSKVSDPLEEDQYLDTWLALHSFHAPLEEYEEWRNYHQSQSFASQDQRIHSMILTATMNPYFYIQN